MPTKSIRARASLLEKAHILDQALALVKTKEIRPKDIAVLWYIATSLDSTTGEAVRRYATIADRCGMSRTAAVESIARLKACQLVKNQPRYFKNGPGKLATAFRLAGEFEEQSNPDTDRGSSRWKPGKVVSQFHPIHNGNEAHQKRPCSEPIPSRDWSTELAWLHKKGRYKELWGFGSEDLARNDLDRLRREKGDNAVADAIARAKELNLYSKSLIDFLNNTWPRK